MADFESASIWGPGRGLIVIDPDESSRPKSVRAKSVARVLLKCLDDDVAWRVIVFLLEGLNGRNSVCPQGFYEGILKEAADMKGD